MSYRRAVTCSYCYSIGHTKRGCTKLKKDAAEGNSYAASQAPKPRKCSYCKQPGHTRRKCDDLHNDKIDAILKNRRWSQLIVKDMKECGIGIGTIFKVSEQHHDYIIGMVTGFSFPSTICYKKPSLGFLKMRFFKGTVDNPSYRWNYGDSHGGEHIIRLNDCYSLEDTSVEWDKVKLKSSMRHSKNFQILVPLYNQQLEKVLPLDFLSGRIGIEKYFEDRVR